DFVFTVETSEHAALFAGAGVEDEIHFTKAVVVVRGPANDDFLDFGELHGLRRAFEIDVRPRVGKHRNVESVVVVNANVAESGGDSHARTRSNRIPSDETARSVARERYHPEPVRHDELTPRNPGNASKRNHGSLRHGDGRTEHQR